MDDWPKAVSFGRKCLFLREQYNKDYQLRFCEGHYRYELGLKYRIRMSVKRIAGGYRHIPDCCRFVAEEKLDRLYPHHNIMHGGAGKKRTGFNWLQKNVYSLEDLIQSSTTRYKTRGFIRRMTRYYCMQTGGGYCSPDINGLNLHQDKFVLRSNSEDWD